MKMDNKELEELLRAQRAHQVRMLAQNKECANIILHRMLADIARTSPSHSTNTITIPGNYE